MVMKILILNLTSLISDNSIPGNDVPHHIKTVNLDVTTLIVLVSDVTNGGAIYSFSDPILQEQAEEERKVPTLPSLLKFLEGKRTHFLQHLSRSKLCHRKRVDLHTNCMDEVRRDC